MITCPSAYVKNNFQPNNLFTSLVAKGLIAPKMYREKKRQLKDGLFNGSIENNCLSTRNIKLDSYITIYKIKFSTVI